MLEAQVEIEMPKYLKKMICKFADQQDLTEATYIIIKDYEHLKRSLDIHAHSQLGDVAKYIDTKVDIYPEIFSNAITSYHFNQRKRKEGEYSLNPWSPTNPITCLESQVKDYEDFKEWKVGFKFSVMATPIYAYHNDYQVAFMNNREIMFPKKRDLNITAFQEDRPLYTHADVDRIRALKSGQANLCMRTTLADCYINVLLADFRAYIEAGQSQEVISG